MSSRPVYRRVSSGNSTHDSTHAISGGLSQHVSRSEPTIVSLAHPALERRLPQEHWRRLQHRSGNGDGLAASTIQHRWQLA